MRFLGCFLTFRTGIRSFEWKFLCGLGGIKKASGKSRTTHDFSCLLLVLRLVLTRVDALRTMLST